MDTAPLRATRAMPEQSCPQAMSPLLCKLTLERNVSSQCLATKTPRHPTPTPTPTPARMRAPRFSLSSSETNQHPRFQELSIPHVAQQETSVTIAWSFALGAVN